MSKEKMDDILASIRQEYGIPANEIVVYRNHKEIYKDSSEGFFHHYIYSATKLTTMTAMLQLVERSLIGLDDKVSRYVPEFADTLVRDGDKLRKSHREMTIRDLASMQSGLNYDLEIPQIRECVQRGETSTMSIIKALAKAPLDFDPESHYQYSLGHDVIGLIVQLVSGLRFDEYCRTYIFEPLGMKNTGFHAYDDMQKQYRYDDGSFERLEGNTFVFGPDYFSGGAGIVTTSQDYCLLLDALACKGIGSSGARILREESIDAMRTPSLSAANRLEFQQKFPFARQGYSYGLGVRILVEKINSRSNIGEFGWDGAAGAYCLCDPDIGLCVYYSQDVRFFPFGGSDVHPKVRDWVYDNLLV